MRVEGNYNQDETLLLLNQAIEYIKLTNMGSFNLKLIIEREKIGYYQINSDNFKGRIETQIKIIAIIEKVKRFQTYMKKVTMTDGKNVYTTYSKSIKEQINIGESWIVRFTDNNYGMRNGEVEVSLVKWIQKIEES